MSEVTEGVSGQGTAASTPSTSSTTPTKDAGGTYDSNTKVDSISDLKEAAPEVWNAMLMGIAQSICTQMQRAQTRLKQMMRKASSR